MYYISIIFNYVQKCVIIKMHVKILQVFLLLSIHSLKKYIWRFGTLYFKDPLLTRCLFTIIYLLACILLAYWLFISTYKAHINALFLWPYFRWINPIPYLNLKTLLTYNKQQISSLLRENS